MICPAPSAPLAPGRFRAALHALYAALDAEVARLGPVCELSGRCCRFAEYGHTLFLSDPEAALLLDEAPPPCRPLDQGDSCPWQDAAGHCTARGARPLGCRVYFCDPRYQAHAPLVSEAFIGRLKRLVDEHGLTWNYAPLHRHLHQAESEGRFSPATSARREVAPSPPPPPADFAASARSHITGSEALVPVKGVEGGFLT